MICLQDRALPVSLQRKMIVDSPCQHVFELNSDHSPFFSQPRQLAECLLRVALVTTSITARDSSILKLMEVVMIPSFLLFRGTKSSGRPGPSAR
jgi:hypothetical protein